MTPAVRRIVTQLTALRMARGWNQFDTARAAGLNKHYLSVVERGVKATSAATIDQLAGVFDLELTLAPRPLALVDSVDDLWPRLRELRVGLGLTLQDIADATGIHPSNLSAYENGRRNPDPATLFRIIAALGGRLAIVGARR